MSIASLFDTIARYREALIPVGGSVAQAARGLRAIGRVLLGGIVGIRERARRMPKEGIILILIFMAFERPAPAQTQSLETHGAQSPAVIANDVTITYGLSPDQMQELTKAATAGAVGPLADKIVELSQKLGVTRDATVTFLHILGQQEVPLESLGQKLHEVAEKYKSAIDRLAALDPQDPATHDLIVRADAALKAGHFDEGDRFLSQAEQTEVAAARQAEEVVRQAQAAVDQRLLRAAAAADVRGNIAMTKLQYLAAAQHFQDAVDRVPAGHPDQKGQFLIAKADALYHQGDERGDNAALVDAIATFRLALPQDDRDRVPRQWAMGQNSLGNALVTLGERQGETTSLKEAVHTYRLALEVYRHDLGLVDWAITEANLGVALQRLGERESGTAQLELAVAAHRAALGAIAPYYAVLEEDTRGRIPWMPWAVTQSNLGAALQTLAEREGGTGQLKGAVAAYRAALEEYTRDRAPLQWALTQMNLGNVLRTLGEREGSTARLEEAVAAYRATLEECTRERVPLDWAATQNNLGVLLRTLGLREHTKARLEEAVVAHRAALEEFTRDRVPLEWAMTQNNLGIALKTLGELESGTARLEEAVAAYRAALEEYTPDGAPVQWTQTQMNLGNTLLRLGQRADGTAQIEQAVAVYRKALKVTPMPIDQANLQFNMGIALSEFGRRTHSTDSLKEALMSFRQACAVFREVGLMQLSIPCISAISPLQRDLEPDAPSIGEIPKTSG